MSSLLRYSIALGILAQLAVTAVHAQDCKPDQAWQHEHVTGKGSTVMTTDVKGSRSTRIEVCRTDEASDDQVVVEVWREGAHKGQAIPGGKCVDYLAKWVVVRSNVAKGATWTGKVAGTARVCKE